MISLMTFYLALPGTRPDALTAPQMSTRDLACCFLCSIHHCNYLYTCLRQTSVTLLTEILWSQELLSPPSEEPITRPSPPPPTGGTGAGWPRRGGESVIQAQPFLEVWLESWKGKNVSLFLKLLGLIRSPRALFP